MTADPQALERAAEAIRAAEGLVVMADTGMGAEAGRAEFHDNAAFWQTYPPLAKLGIGLGSLATPQAFERDPALAWGYYGQRIVRCRHGMPHAGFAILRHWLETKPQGGFVFTSCVDGCFQRGGFAEERIVECHGSLEHLQCVKPCCAATWPAPADLQLAVDPETMRAGGALPRCVRCGGLVRPNVLMAGDGAWSSGRTLAQQVRFRAWQGSLARGRFGVIESAPARPGRGAADRGTAGRRRPGAADPHPSAGGAGLAVLIPLIGRSRRCSRRWLRW